MSSPLRTRLTLWYVGAFSIAFLLFSGGVYWFVERILRERMDANLRITLEAIQSTLSRRMASPGSSLSLGRQDSDSSAAETVEDPLFPGQVAAVVSADGRVLARRPAGSALKLRLPAFPVHASSSPQFYELPESHLDADDSCRGAYQLLTPVVVSEPTLIIVVTISTEQLSDQLDALQNVLAIAVALALILAGFGGWLLARHSLSPLAAMASATERLTANNLEERLPAGSGDELGRLASRFNDLLSRLSASFVQQRQFMADASHELRTPLSVVRTAAQVTLQKPERSDVEYREALAVIEQQAARLSRIVEDMFALARADMKQLPLDVVEVYLDEVIADTMRASSVLAERKGVQLQSDNLLEAPYRGDERLLREMISNLLDNAIKFTPEGGTVVVRLCQTGPDYEITVADTGCGIPPELQPRIFERFFRADHARVGTNGLGGAGLGLAIARSIAELHRGQLTLQCSGPEGSTFCISLPLHE